MVGAALLSRVSSSATPRQLGAVVTGQRVPCPTGGVLGRAPASADRDKQYDYAHYDPAPNSATEAWGMPPAQRRSAFPLTTERTRGNAANGRSENSTPSPDPSWTGYPPQPRPLPNSHRIYPPSIAISSLGPPTAERRLRWSLPRADVVDENL